MPAGTSVLGVPAVSSVNRLFSGGIPARGGEKVLCGLLPADEQAAVFHLDLHRVSQEMVAHPQGKKGRGLHGPTGTAPPEW